MPSAKFCSECGAALPTDHASTFLARPTCARCAPRFRLARLLIVVSLALCLAIGYIVGRNLAPREPQYLIGTPIDPQASPSQSDTTILPLEANKPLEGASQAVGSSSTAAIICGAPTKSGKPCQRKVAGGGYCYQHRDKYGPKKQASDGK